MSDAASGDDGGYRTPAREARGELRERGSRFLAAVAPAGDEPEAERFVDRLRSEYPDATHHCWAWRLGAAGRERSADDGEPAGTAGVPMLQILRGAGLSDVVAVVVRWFGGTKLGKGGLARAYAGALREALAECPVRLEVPRTTVEVGLPYERLGAVKRLVQPPAVELAGERYGADVRLRLTVYRSRLAALGAALAELGLSIDGEEPP